MRTPTVRDRATLALVVAAVLLPLPARAQEVIDRVLATVGGQVITLSDAQAALAFGLAEPAAADADPLRAALDELIRRQLMLDEVERYSSPEPDPAALDQRLAAVRARFPSAEAFADALARTGLTAPGLRDLFRNSLRIEQYLRDRFSAAVQPGEEDVERYYAEHPAEFRRQGDVVPYETAREAIREELIRQRRQEVIADWLDRLRRRIEVTDQYLPAAGPRDRGRR